MSKNEQSRSHEHTFSRRRVLAGLVVGGAAIYGAATHQREVKEIYDASVRELFPPSSGEIINQEIERMGIVFFPQEQNLWQNYALPKVDGLDNVDKIRIADQRVAEVQDRMLLSENPHFQHAASVIEEQKKNGRLQITLNDDLAEERRRVSMLTSPYKTPDGHLLWTIEVSAKDVIETSDEVFMAINFAHEVRHIEEFLSIPAYNEESIPIDERIANFKRDRQKDDFFLQKEAQGYAVSALSYIYERGLWYKGGSGALMEQLAAKYITSGKSEQSEEWQSYVGSLIGIR